MNPILSAILAVTLMTSLVLSAPAMGSNAKCTSDNCKLPDCRCWNEKVRPGNFSDQNTPQIIVLSFDFAFNADTADKYMRLFEGLTNPNGCPAKGTFFAQYLDTEVETLKELEKAGHELGINSYNGVIPTNKAEWEEDISQVLGKFKDAGIDTASVKGMRAPNLFSGGNDEFEALRNKGLHYDSSCVNVDYSDPKKLLWPFTLDYVNDLPKCSIGHTVNETFPGIWQVPMPVLKYGDVACATPSGCLANINGTDDVFTLFFDAFDAHYYHDRTPFVLDIDAQWVTDDFRVTGTMEFLEIIAAYQDTWIVTMDQALAWVQNPVEMSFGASFKPWEC